MKRKIICAGIVLLLSGITTVNGQDRLPEPRRTAEEQAAYEKSIPVNPAKIAPQIQVDARIEATSSEASPVNWKPKSTPVEEIRAIEPASNENVPLKSAHSVNYSQPAGIQTPGKTTNYRNDHGLNTQPLPSPASNTLNYRNIKGSKTQPEGDKPKR